MTNPSRTPVAVLGLLLLAALVGGALYWWWPSPSADPVPEPSSPAPSTSEAPSEPATTPTEPSAPDPSPAGPLTEWSTPLTPVCGEVFTGEDFDSALRFDLDHDVLSDEDSFPVSVRNTGDGPVIASVDRYDIAVPVLTDSSGTVVAMGSLEPVLAEGYSVLALDPGDDTTVGGTLNWVVSCEGGDDPLDPDPVPAGEYELFLLASTVAEPDEGADQIQGGPFAITVDPEATHDFPDGTVEGAADIPSCGQDWPDRFDGTPGTIELGSGPVYRPDGLVMGGTFTLEEAAVGASVYAQIVIIDDGVVVGPYPHASDALVGWYASPGLGAPIAGMSEPVTCTGDPLAPGDYEAALVVSTIGTSGPTLAVSEAVPVTVK